MNITITRTHKLNDRTIGRLEIDGNYFCDTLEDKDRGLDKKMSMTDIRRLKNPGTTAIPTGTYDVSLRVQSARFGKVPFYQEVCKGLLPRMLSVPGFDGVLIHCGNTPSDTEGCILVGVKSGNIIKDSQKTFRALYKKLLEGRHDITITIK